MTHLPFAALLIAASLVGAPALAQTPQTGGTPAGRAATPAVTAPATSSAAAPAAKTPLVDINSATKEELDALPGIGAARSEAIIKGRPYKSKDDLRRNKVLPSNVYQGIKDRIVARQS